MACLYSVRPSFVNHGRFPRKKANSKYRLCTHCLPEPPLPSRRRSRHPLLRRKATIHRQHRSAKQRHLLRYPSRPLPDNRQLRRLWQLATQYTDRTLSRRIRHRLRLAGCTRSRQMARRSRTIYRRADRLPDHADFLDGSVSGSRTEHEGDEGRRRAIRRRKYFQR